MAKTLTEYIVEKASKSRNDAKSKDKKKSKKSTSGGGTLTEFLLGGKSKDKNKKKKTSSGTLSGYFVSKILEKKTKEKREQQKQQLSFGKELEQGFYRLSRQTEEIKTKIYHLGKVMSEVTEQDLAMAQNIEILTDMLAQRAELEKAVFTAIAHKFSNFPEIEIAEAKKPQQLSDEEEDDTEDIDSVDESSKNTTNSIQSNQSSSKPPTVNPPSSPDKKAEGGITPGLPKKDKTQSLVPYADVMQLPLQAAGIASVNLISQFIKSSGAIGGFFLPYVKSLVKPFALALGVTDSILSNLLGGPAAAAEREKDIASKEFGKTWGKFLNDEDFISKFIDKTFTGITGENVTPGDFTGNASEKAVKIAKMLMKDLGYADFQAAGIVGNLTQENTNLVPDLLEGSKKGLLPQAMPGKCGYGWAQWTTASRQQKLYDLAKSMGVDPDKQGLTDAINYEMLKREFPTYDREGRFKASKTIEEASNWVLHNYERPADQGPREQAERIADSKAVLAKISASRGTSIGNSKNILGTYIVDGPESGFDSNIQGLPVTLHGKEIVRVFDGGFEVYPIENKEYSMKDDPMGVFKRWSEIASGLDAKVSSYFSAGGSAEFWKIAALTSKEDSLHSQGQADVAQSLYNRAAIGSYPGGRSISSIITAPGQYQPTFNNAGKWNAIKDRKSAIAAVGNASKVDMAAKSITNPTLQQAAARFVGGRTDFMGESQKPYMKPGDITRGKNYNFHGWFYDAKLPKPAPIPKTVSSQTRVVATSDKKQGNIVVNRVGGGSSQPSVSPSSRSSTRSSGGGAFFDPLKFIRELTMRRSR